MGHTVSIPDNQPIRSPPFCVLCGTEGSGSHIDAYGTNPHPLRTIFRPHLSFRRFRFRAHKKCARRMRRAYYLGIVAPLFLTFGLAHWLGRRSFSISLLGAAAATGFIFYLLPYGVRYRHSGGRFHFTFADPIYAELFAEMNGPSASHASKAAIRSRVQ